MRKPALVIFLLVLASSSHALAQDTPRFRFGLGLSGGTLLDQEGGVGGLHLSLGARLHELFAVYYHGHVLAGAFVDGRTGQAVLLNYNAALAELNLGPFQVGAGPSLDVTTGCSMDATQLPPTGSCSDGVAPGLGTRVGLVLGAFALSGDAHFTFYETGAAVGLLLGLGVQL